MEFPSISLDYSIEWLQHRSTSRRKQAYSSSHSSTTWASEGKYMFRRNDMEWHLLCYPQIRREIFPHKASNPQTQPEMQMWYQIYNAQSSLLPPNPINFVCCITARVSWLISTPNQPCPTSIYSIRSLILLWLLCHMLHHQDPFELQLVQLPYPKRIPH